MQQVGRFLVLASPVLGLEVFVNLHDVLQRSSSSGIKIIIMVLQANSQKDNQILLMAKYLDDIDIQERLLTNLVRRARAGSETLASLVSLTSQKPAEHVYRP